LTANFRTHSRNASNQSVWRGAMRRW
jgi:hypothetical protein